MKDLSRDELEFVVFCVENVGQRLGMTGDEIYRLLTKVFDTIELFFDGLIDKSVAIERLRYEKPDLQVCFCSQEAIDTCVRFVESEGLG